MFGDSAAQFRLRYQVKQVWATRLAPTLCIIPELMDVEPMVTFSQSCDGSRDHDQPISLYSEKSARHLREQVPWAKKTVELHLYHSQECGKNVALGVHTPVSKSQAHRFLAGNFQQVAYLL